VPAPSRPDWDALYRTAEAQGGYFSTAQAAEAGYSSPLLAKYLRNGRVRRVRRGVYRLVHFPAGEHEDFVELWLWSQHTGVLSHDTALMLHGLTDALPARVHMTVPRVWSRRHLVSIPSVLVLHFDDLATTDRTWIGAVPVTAPARALRETLDAGGDPDAIAAAAAHALERNLVSPTDVRYLAPRRARR
jgi:predicted transcriptional regulator of viral defense system